MVYYISIIKHILYEFQTLKKHEYFGKFGKILKVVINQSTSYIGTQVKLNINEMNLKGLNTTQ